MPATHEGVYDSLRTSASLLVADEDTDTLVSLYDLLQARFQGLDITTVATPQQVAPRVRAVRPTVLVVGFPVRTELLVEIVREARVVQPRLKAVLLVINGDIEAAAQAAQEPAIVGVLPKPVAPEALLLLVQRAIDQARTGLSRIPPWPTQWPSHQSGAE